jgi:hypothetical protein
VDHEVGPEESDHATPPTEEREEARLAIAGQSQEGWACPLQPRLDLATGHFQRLSLDPQMAGRRRKPAPERLITKPEKTCGRVQGLRCSRRQARRPRQGLERLAQS